MGDTASDHIRSAKNRDDDKIFDCSIFKPTKEICSESMMYLFCHSLLIHRVGPQVNGNEVTG